MPIASRTFRIFVSSTFNDMKAERNALQEKVFPELQKLCAARGCRFQAIDLRWGVSEEAALDQQTMNICMTELKRCQKVTPRPNFIILLGDRYGWLPLPPQIEASEFREILSRVTANPENDLLNDWYRLDTNAIPPEYVLRPRREEVFAEADYDSWGKTEATLQKILLGAINRLGWEKEDLHRGKYECSATHQEIIEGALKLRDEREHVFAFLRNIQNLDDLPPGCIYTDAGVKDAQALKETIRHAAGVTPFEYNVTWDGPELKSHIEQFTADALGSLTRIIEEEFRQLEQLDDLTREDIAHQDFGAERCRHFVGRQKILSDIATYIRGKQSYPLVVYGVSGSGKSALMAKATLDAAEMHKQAYIIQRFIGATPESTDIRSLLENLCREIAREFQFERLKEEELAGVSDQEAQDKIAKKYEIPDEYRYLSEKLREFLGMIPDNRNFLLFLDALDQLSASDNAHSLNWMPSALPANVKIVVSVLKRDDDAGQCLRSARSKVRESALVRLEDMTPPEGSMALTKWLDDAKRGLTDEQEESVLAGFRSCPLPLYLKLAFEEARRWKSYDGLPGLAGDVPGIVGDMLNRLRGKKNHGEVLVRTFLGLLSAARNGLSETEVLELLSEDNSVMTDLKTRSARSPEASGVPAVVWLRLYHDLAPYMMERSADNTVLLNFYHRQVGETVKATYLKPEYHAQLAHYFADEKRPLWLSDGGNRRPNHRRCTELPYQQKKSEMWDQLVVTLTDLDFVDAKSKAGMVYDLVADYNHAFAALPEGQEEVRKEEERQGVIQKYVDDLIAHSSDPDNVPLPDPPPSVEIKTDHPTSERHGGWTRLERVKAWGHFVGGHIRKLAAREEPVFQIAWNSVDSGPVAERVVEMENDGRGLSQEWIRLRNRPPFTPNPACLKTLEGHTQGVNAVALTPDGRRAVSGSGDNTVRVWDLETGECLKTLEGHTQGVNAVALTPDGRRAVSGSGYLDKTVRVWDLETGECLKVLEGYTSVLAVSITHDGRCAVSESSDKTLRVWDLETGECLKTLEGHTREVSAVSITPEGRRAVSGSKDKTLRVWDLETGECLKTLKGHTDDVNSVSITPDGRRAVSGSDDKTLRVWDMETGACLKTLEGHTERVYAVSLTPDGCRAVSGSWDNTLRVWDLETGECLKTLEGHTNWVMAVSITPDGRRAVSGSLDKTIRVWDLETGECLKTLKGHTGNVNAVSVTPDDRRAVSGSLGNTLRVWDLETGECLKTLEGHTDWVYAVSVTLDGRRAVSGSDDKTLRVWDLETGECLKTLEGHTDKVEAVSITPDGRRAVSGSWDETLRVWDLETGACLKTLVGHTDWVRAVSITPDGRRAVSGSRDNTLRVWDLETGEYLKTLEGHTHYVEAVSITLDGRRAVSGSWDNTLRVWDLETGECLKTLEGANGVKAVSVTPDGRRAVSGSWDNTLRVWDLETGECLAICGMESLVLSVAVHGASLVAGEESGQVDMLTIENYHLDRPIATAARLWMFDRQTWDTNLTALCYSCGELFIVKDEWIGHEIACPLNGCGKPLKLNSFVCDNQNQPTYKHCVVDQPAPEPFQPPVMLADFESVKSIIVFSLVIFFCAIITSGAIFASLRWHWVWLIGIPIALGCIFIVVIFILIITGLFYPVHCPKCGGNGSWWKKRSIQCATCGEYEYPAAKK